MSYIPYVDLGAQWERDRGVLLPVIDHQLGQGDLIGGDQVQIFESEVAVFCGSRFAVALNSGTDALILALHVSGIGRGDEVITQANSFVATAASIVHVGGRPVFAEVLPDQSIDPDDVRRRITPHTKAIMPVHLSGRIGLMDEIVSIAEEFNLIIIEDAAQAIGSKLHGRPSGSFGHFGCFSTHPLKNLGALGDGGFLVTSDPIAAERVRLLRSHGMLDRNTVIQFGGVSRLDALQAVVLQYRLGLLDAVIERRRTTASLYMQELSNLPLALPWEHAGQFNTYHTFVIQADDRDALRTHLERDGIGTAIHYPVPIHLQPASASLGLGIGSLPRTESQARRILSLPIHENLTRYSIERIIESIKDFYER